MARWFTSDLHLGHANIIEYCDRPFADVDEMNRALVERWNRVVAADDEVWVLGDMAMGQIADSLGLVRGLAGRKILLAGNHDRCWFGHAAKRKARVDEWTATYRDAGFDEIHQDSVNLSIGDADVVACHFPYQGDSHDADRYSQHRPIDRGRWIVHGHVHNTWRVQGRQINVGVDVWDYQPVAEDTLATIMSAGV